MGMRCAGFPVTSMATMGRLGGLPLFRGLDGAALARLTAGAREIEAPTGAPVYRRGEAGQGLYVVVYGQVKLALPASQGAEKIVELVGPDGCFGGSAIFLDRPPALSATAITDTRLIAVARETVLAEMERTAAFARNLAASLSRRLRYLIGALENCMVRSGTERVAGYLLDHVPGSADGGEGLVALPAQKGIIASQLNLTQAHFSRILHDLAEAGLIEVAGRSVRIRDIGRLREHCAEA